MTLDELIEALELVRQQCPASGVATVALSVGRVIEPSYDMGYVFLYNDDDADGTE